MELNLFALFLIIIAFNIFLNIYIKFSFKYNLVSIPKKRDSHKTITPKGGGIVIYFVLVLFLLFKIYNNNIDDFDIAILISTPIITILSFFDDKYNINWKYKLLLDFITVIIIFLFLYNQFNLIYFEFIYWIFFPFLILSLMWFINLINFTDGSDGFLSLFTIINFLTIFLVKFILNFDIFISSIIFIILIFNFLFYNLKPAKIFLGDTGSRLIAVIFIISMMFDYIYYDITIIKIWLFTLSIALIDTGITLIQRLIIHHNILQEHKDHAFQILANRYNHNYSILWLIFNYIFIIFPILTLNFLQIISFLLSAILIIFLLMIQILYIKIKLK